jgi:hypothetical protein
MCRSKKTKILTFDVEIDRIADSVTLDVVRDASVDARLIPANVLQDEALVADNDAVHRADSEWNILKRNLPIYKKNMTYHSIFENNKHLVNRCPF